MRRLSPRAVFAFGLPLAFLASVYHIQSHAKILPDFTRGDGLQRASRHLALGTAFQRERAGQRRERRGAFPDGADRGRTKELTEGKGRGDRLPYLPYHKRGGACKAKRGDYYGPGGPAPTGKGDEGGSEVGPRPRPCQLPPRLLHPAARRPPVPVPVLTRLVFQNLNDLYVLYKHRWYL